MPDEPFPPDDRAAPVPEPEPTGRLSLAASNRNAFATRMPYPMPDLIAERPAAAQSRPLPLDQADGLRRLFAQPRVHFVPVVSNPEIAFGGVMLERLCTALTEQGCTTLVVDASERAEDHDEMALLDIADCIEPLSPHVHYLAARGLALHFVDPTGSTGAFLDALATAAPHCDAMLVHAPAAELARLFMRQHRHQPVRPLLLAGVHAASVTHAYAAMKWLTQRAGLVVHDLLLSAPERSPRAERIAMQLATCADDFLGAVLRDWVALDPACDPAEAPTPALRRLVRELLRPADAADEPPPAFTARPGHRTARSAPALARAA